MSMPGLPHLPITPAEEAPAALRAMGLSVEVLHEALAAGELAASGVSRFFPKIYRGTARWAHTVAQLRERLVEHDWTMTEPKNSPRIVSPDGTISLLVVGGNPDTGAETAMPRTARRRGPTTRYSIDVNQLVLQYDLAGLPRPDRSRTGDEPVMWVLLYHRSKQPNQTRAELSLPLEVTEDGEIAHWQRRILLPAVLHDVTAVLPRDDEGDDDVDFKIEPR